MSVLHEFLATHSLCHGIGELDEDGNGECSSIAALNWYLYGECNDVIYPSESAVIGQWVIHIQDVMSLKMLNSDRWKAALEKLPGLGQEPEKELVRINLIVEWMWVSVLPRFQPIADRHGFGEQWKNILQERTAEAIEAIEAIEAARAAAEAAWAAYVAARAADAACAAAEAARAAADAARAARAAWVVRAAAAADAAADAAWAAADAVARAAGDAARAAWAADFWAEIDPCGLLEKLVTV